jgi:hypothetical protein
VDDAELVGTLALGVLGSRGDVGAAASGRRGRHVNRGVPERTPHPFVRAGLRIDDPDAPVPIPVGDERLVGLGVHKDLGGLMRALRVLVAAAHVVPAADLLDELALGRELQQHVVVALRDVSTGARVDAGDPHAVLVVHEDPVLGVRPVESLARSAPCLDELAVLVELDYRGGRVGALLLGRGPGPVQDPHVVVPIDGHPRRHAHDPVVRQLRRPSRIELVLRHAPAAVLRRHDRRSNEPCCHGGDHDQGRQDAA